MPGLTIKVHLRSAAGEVRTLQARSGRSLMQAAVDAGIEGIAADCGGCLNCATCHVIVAAEWAARLPPPAPDEQAMLEMTAAPAQATSRLSCQIVLHPTLDGIAVSLPPTQY